MAMGSVPKRIAAEFGRIIAGAVEIALTSPHGPATEALSFYLTDISGEIEKRPGIVAFGICRTEPNELVRIYVDFNDRPMTGPLLDPLTLVLKPFIESGPNNVVLEQCFESIKVVTRHPGEINR
jgi:hypothetical protein